MEKKTCGKWSSLTYRFKSCCHIICRPHFIIPAGVAGGSVGIIEIQGWSSRRNGTKLSSQSMMISAWLSLVHFQKIGAIFSLNPLDLDVIVEIWLECKSWKWCSSFLVFYCTEKENYFLLYNVFLVWKYIWTSK